VVQDAPVVDTVRRMELLGRDSRSHAAQANTETGRRRPTRQRRCGGDEVPAGQRTVGRLGDPRVRTASIRTNLHQREEWKYLVPKGFA
jgi:hypothetical protein